MILALQLVKLNQIKLSERLVYPDPFVKIVALDLLNFRIEDHIAKPRLVCEGPDLRVHIPVGGPESRSHVVIDIGESFGVAQRGHRRGRVLAEIDQKHPVNGVPDLKVLVNALDAFSVWPLSEPLG